MNETQWVEQFNRELDRLQTGQSVDSEEIPTELRQTLALAQELKQTNLIVGSEKFRAALRFDLLEHAARPSAKGAFSMVTISIRKLALTALALAFLLLTLFSLAPVRSFAAGLAQQIGVMFLVNEPTLGEQMAAGQTTTYDPPVGPEVRPTIPAPAQLTLDEAAAAADFAVASITPPAGYELASRTVYGEGSYGNGSEVLIHTTYHKTVKDQISFIGLEQAVYPSDMASMVVELKIGQAPVTEVNVRGYAGLFVEQANIVVVPDETGGTWQTVGTNLLLWEEDGFLFSLMSDTLGLDELLAAAATMTQ